MVTAALPYANGPLHLGHLLEFVQADIWVRYQRLVGNTCHFVCGDDAHGTPIMLHAERLQITPEALITQVQASHQRDLTDFGIVLDNFYSTHSPENRALSAEFYRRLTAKGDITQKTITQWFDPVKALFLADRYVKGDCPRCGVADQYGDNCEQCGATYSATELKNPRSVLSGAVPIEKESQHYFFQLDRYGDFLKQWLQDRNLQPEIINKLNEWFAVGLASWNISRDAPYFGFEIPNAPDKYFYVWLDAPMGYMASFKNYCQKQPGLNFDHYWSTDSHTELYHFIGKDIAYFHTLFWPALLQGAGFRTPTGVYAHGFLTVNGQKMSKSRGTLIEIRRYLDVLKPDYLRYYFAAKLSDGIEDIDFQPEDFVARVNADLVGKLVNIASRTAGFLTTLFAGRLSTTLPASVLYSDLLALAPEIQSYYEHRTYHRVVRMVMAYADQVNRWIDSQKPWVLARTPDKQLEVQAICTVGLNLFRVLILYLKPIVPALARAVEDFLQTTLTWESRERPLIGCTIQPFKPLLLRVEQETVMSMMTAPTAVEASPPLLPDQPPIQETIRFEEFKKVDLRVARVLTAVAVPNAEKLIELTLDIGNGQTRRVFAGIKAAYEPPALVGKQVVVVANLAPRTMRFGVSEGMILATGPGGQDLWVLEPNAQAAPGSPIR